MLRWQDVLNFAFLGNPVTQWALALATFLVTLTVLPIVKGFIGARRRHWASLRQQLPRAVELTTLLVERTSRLFLWAVALYLASRYLTFTPRLERVLTVTIVALFWFQAGLWAMATIRFGIDRRRSLSSDLDAVLAGSTDVIIFSAGLIVWAMVLLLALDNLGVEIKPLLAGLGIGGIAIALAVQTVLGDLLASMSIALDKPFGIGDFLTLGDFQGTVEHIGVKSTQLRSISGEQIIIANADMVKARVRNFGRMRERRTVFQFGVNYDTSVEALAAIPAEVRRIVEAQPNTRFDRCHLLSYGDTALQFELVYFVTRPDFNAYADAQQAINLALLAQLRGMQVQLAASTRAVVYVENPAARASAGPPGAPQPAGSQSSR
ncbi:MAG TPA: mechanosensitive ion channel family protein [Steroidobacteraceae bacterium]|nr:mechanosensitive ion channel family protein [Steroidobacteraceae bacterium]